MVAERAGRTGFVLNADDPLIADLGRDRELQRRAGRHLLRDRGPVAGAARAPARPRRQALPPLRPPLRLRARLRRPPRPLLVPELRRRPARARRRRDRDRAARDARLARRASARPTGELELELPLPGLYNVYNALAALAAALRLGVGARAAVARRWRRCEAAFGRVETIEVAGTPVSILLIKNPAGANEVLRTLRLEAGDGDAASTSGSRSTTGSPTAATSPGSGTPTSSCSPARVAPGRLRRHPGAGDGGAAQVRRARPERRSRSSRVDRALARPRRRRAPTGRLFALPTYTALIELRTLLADARPGEGVLAMSATPARAEAIWHDVECGAYAADLRALGRARPPRPAGPVLELGAGDRARRAAPRRAQGIEVVALDRSRELARRARRRAPRPPGSRSRRCAPTPAGCALERELRRRARADAVRAPARRPAPSARRCWRRRRAHSPPGGTFAAALLAEDARASPGDAGRRAAARRARARRLGLLEPAARGRRRRRRDRGPPAAPDRLARGRADREHRRRSGSTALEPRPARGRGGRGRPRAARADRDPPDRRPRRLGRSACWRRR